MNNYVKINELIGKTITKIEKSDDELIFKTLDGDNYKFYHEQNCCEDVRIEDICGDLDNLIGVPLLQAEEVSKEDETDWGSCTWTFYKFATIKGYVTVRWYGESNGYYSEDVDLIKYKVITEEEKLESMKEFYRQ